MILPELHLVRDAPAGVALILQLLHDSGQSLSQIVRQYPVYAIVKDKLALPAIPLAAVYESLTAAFPDAIRDTQDGLRLSWSDRWLHVRPSGTEPVVRAIAEAPTAKDAHALVARAREQLEKT